jgi:4-amino-4-deoxy-L-arabinose transferase-like glycosyltransferase
MRVRRSLALLLLVIFCALVATHAPLLKVPYFWDEAGYYVPAAYDLLTKAQFIPSSTLSNAHPPLVMSYLALAWKIFGYSPATSRTAMLLVAAFALAGLFFLARVVSNSKIATATVVCAAVYPVFFAQSSMVHLDLAAAAFSFWGLGLYFRGRLLAAAALFSLAALAKETAVITPLALFAWELRGAVSKTMRENIRSASLLLPFLPLTLWFAYHFFRTGHVFGNPEYFRYNVGATLTPARVLFALVRRAWQLIGHMNLYVLTVGAALAMMFPPVRDGVGERPRIAIPVQLTLLVVIAAHVLFFSLFGGALLARYMLTVVPLGILICVSTIWRRVTGWQVVIVLVCVAFAMGLFINPPYVFAPEDNLSYRDFVSLHQEAAQYLEQQARGKRILTAWPGSDELSKPFLGYVAQPMNVMKLSDFSPEQLENARAANFNFAFVFSTKYEPPRRLWQPRFWEQAQRKFFDYHRDLPPEAVAGILGGEIVFVKRRGGHWVAVMRVQRIENAKR